jgi:pyruvate dehydrogenase E2 component (dihydrolipoamide acetyltransferase)
MATDVIMPQMGESIAEGTITKWLKSPGDAVSRDEPLFEISTDKVDAEIPSPAAGTLLEILVPPGRTVAVSTVVGRIGGADEKPSAQAAAPEPRPEPPTPPAREARDPAPPPPRPSAPPAPATRPPDGATNVASIEQRIRTRSSPLVRKIAAEHGVDIARITGTGIAGRVTKGDILSFLESSPGAAGRTAGAAAQAARADVFRGPRDQVVPMSVMRRKIAERMAESKHTAAHVATVFEIDYSRIARLRERHKEAFLRDNGVKLTYLPFIFQAVTVALKEFPELNASIDGENIVYHKDINLGMAVALDWGLIVPVIKNADEKSILGLARAANDLADRARSKKLKPEEVANGTFSVTNPGVYGSLFGTPIIPQPQVAILGVGTIEKRPVVVTDEAGNDALAVRTMGYLALSFDHRLIDGAVADQFMARIKAILEDASFSLA